MPWCGMPGRGGRHTRGEAGVRERHAGWVSMVMGRGGARCFDWWTVGAGLSGAAGGVHAWRSRAGQGGRGWMAWWPRGAGDRTGREQWMLCRRPVRGRGWPCT